MADEPTLYEQDVDVNGWVAELQTALQAAGYDPGPLDGKFRWRTAKAVIAYQSSFGLKADGIVGNQTWAALRGRAPEPPGVNNKPYGKTLVQPKPTPEPAPAGAATAAQPAAIYPVDAEPEVCCPDSAADGGLVVPDGSPTEPGGYPMTLRINVPDAEVESVTIDTPMFLLTLRLRFGGGNLAVASPDSPLSYDQDGFRLEVREQVGEFFSGIRVNGIGRGVAEGPMSLGVISGNEFVTTEVRMISPLRYAYLGRATIDLDLPTSYGQARITGGFGYRIDLELTPKAAPPVAAEEAWYETAWEWVDEHATEILVGTVVVGVIIVAPEAAPAVLRLAW